MIGNERFLKLRNTLRDKGYQVTQNYASGRFQQWEVRTTAAAVTFVVLIGTDGFDIFYETDHLTIAEDLKHIEERMNRVPPTAD